jgi:hypothetical protein
MRYLAIAVCAIVFIVGVALGRQDEERSKPSALYMILVSVTLAVAAIPEGEGKNFAEIFFSKKSREIFFVLYVYALVCVTK